MKLAPLLSLTIALALTTVIFAQEEPQISVVYTQQTAGDVGFPGGSHWDSELTFVDADGLQNPRYRNPDNDTIVDVDPGGCLPVFSLVVHHLRKVGEAHADDCAAPPNLSHWYFLPEISVAQNNIWARNFTVPKINATVTQVDVPAGVTHGSTQTSPTPDGTGTVITLAGTAEPGANGVVRVEVDPHGETFFYEFAILAPISTIPTLSAPGFIVMAALLVLISVGMMMRRKSTMRF